MIFLNGRFAAALLDSQANSWVMNVVPVSGPNTLPVIYDRGLIGVMHDWYVCTSDEIIFHLISLYICMCVCVQHFDMICFHLGVSPLTLIQEHMIC